MAIQHNKNKGILFVIIGSILFVLFAGKFILQIIAAIGGILIVNHGLSLQNLPPVWTLIQEWVMNITWRR